MRVSAAFFALAMADVSFATTWHLREPTRCHRSDICRQPHDPCLGRQTWERVMSGPPIRGGHFSGDPYFSGDHPQFSGDHPYGTNDRAETEFPYDGHQPGPPPGQGPYAAAIDEGGVAYQLVQQTSVYPHPLSGQIVQLDTSVEGDTTTHSATFPDTRQAYQGGFDGDGSSMSTFHPTPSYMQHDLGSYASQPGTSYEYPRFPSPGSAPMPIHHSSLFGALQRTTPPLRAFTRTRRDPSKHWQKRLSDTYRQAIVQGKIT